MYVISDLIFVKINEDCYIPFRSTKSGPTSVYKCIYKARIFDNFTIDGCKSNVFYSENEITMLIDKLAYLGIKKNQKIEWNALEFISMANANFRSAINIDECFKHPYYLRINPSKDLSEESISISTLVALIYSAQEEKNQRSMPPLSLYKITEPIFFIGLDYKMKDGITVIPGLVFFTFRKNYNIHTTDLTSRNVLTEISRYKYKTYKTIKEAQKDRIFDTNITFKGSKLQFYIYMYNPTDNIIYQRGDKIIPIFNVNEIKTKFDYEVLLEDEGGDL